MIALSVLAAASTASAQSSVTLFGTVDQMLQRISNSGGPSVTRLHNSGLTSSHIGFRGTEDLGGGMSASFWIEADIQTDNGTGAIPTTSSTNNQTNANSNGGLVFNRRSTLSLASNWGELRVGRDYVPQYRNNAAFDPFGNLGAGTSQALLSTVVPAWVAVRASNSIAYWLPGNLGGIYGTFMHYRGENPSGTPTSGDGTGNGIRVGWASGPFNVSVATGKTSFAAGDTTQSNFGASWDFGVAKVMALITQDKNGALKGKGYLIGGTVPVGVGLIRLSASQYTTQNGITEPRPRKLAIGYVHNLSKRTALYTTYARVRNSGGSANPAAGGFAPAVNSGSSALDLGIRHNF